MRLNYVVIPEEYENGIDSILDDLEIEHQAIHYHGLDLIKRNPLVPSYDKALDELDLWHAVNLWSNAPVVIPTSGATTQDMIDQLPVGSELWCELIAISVEDEAAECGRDFDEVMQERQTPVTEDFKRIMQHLRDEWRLDRFADQ